MLLISFKQASPAKTLVAFLKNNGIPTQYHCADDSHEVHLPDRQHLAVAQAVAHEFVQNPNHPRFQQAAWESGAPARLNTQWSASAIVAQLKQLLFSPVTATILLLAIVIHLLVFGLGLSSVFDALSFQPVTTIAQSGEV